MHAPAVGGCGCLLPPLVVVDVCSHRWWYECVSTSFAAIGHDANMSSLASQLLTMVQTCLRWLRSGLTWCECAVAGFAAVGLGADVPSLASQLVTFCVAVKNWGPLPAVKNWGPLPADLDSQLTGKCRVRLS